MLGMMMATPNHGARTRVPLYHEPEAAEFAEAEPDVEEGQVSDDNTGLLVPGLPPDTGQDTVSLAEQLKVAEQDDGVGHPVAATVATLVAKIWYKPYREEIKSLYEKLPRPTNLDCLKRVELDEEVAAALPPRQKVK